MNKFKICLGSLLVLSLSACASMSKPQSDHLKPVTQTNIILPEGVQLAAHGWPKSAWWAQYHDPQLNALILQAIEQSPTMAIAKARILAAQAQAQSVDAQRGIQLNGSFSLKREKDNINGMSPLPPSAHTGWTRSRLAGLDASLNIDVWGKDRALYQAAMGQVNAQIAEAAQTKMELAVRVAQAYFSLNALHQGLSLQQSALVILQSSLDSAQSRYAGGLVSKAEVMLAAADLANMNQQIIVSQTDISMQRIILLTLIGGDVKKAQSIAFKSLPVGPLVLPNDLNFQLLARRPDLQAMRWQVESALKQVDGAKAAFYPSVNLTGLLGLSEVSIGNLPFLNTHARNIGLSVLLPIFNSGALNANLALNRAGLQRAIAGYNQAVLGAAQEVSQLVARVEGLNQQLQQVNILLNSKTFTAESTAAQYQQGLSSKIQSEEAKLAVLSIQAKQLNLQSQRLNNQLSLIQALGGGYTQ